MAFELSPVPLALLHCDGSLKKTTKSVMSVLEEKVCVSARLPVEETQEMKTTHLIDRMAIVKMMKGGGAQDLPDPQCSGWKEEDGVLCPVLMTNDPAPQGIIELTTCMCKKSLCQSSCSCANNGLCSTKACFYMAEPGSCLNPNETTVEDESEDDEVTP